MHSNNVPRDVLDSSTNSLQIDGIGFDHSYKKAASYWV